MTTQPIVPGVYRSRTTGVLFDLKVSSLNIPLLRTLSAGSVPFSPTSMTDYELVEAGTTVDALFPMRPAAPVNDATMLHSLTQSILQGMMANPTLVARPSDARGLEETALAIARNTLAITKEKQGPPSFAFGADAPGASGHVILDPSGKAQG